TVPIGGYLLVNVDAFIMRKVIAGVVVVFALALFSGLRYSRPPRPATSIALGSIVGVLLAATSVAAPPVILYLLPRSHTPPSRSRRGTPPFSVPPYRSSA